MKDSLIAIFDGVEQPLRLVREPIPELKPGEILVRNEYTTLCRSDLTTFVGRRTEKTPTILGHEIVGRIAAFGLEAARIDCRGDALKEGDRITWGIYASNPESALARRGIPQKGEDLFKYGHERIADGSTLHGGLAEHCILRRNTPIIKIREPIPLPVLALINCSASTAAGALRLAGDIRGRSVFISGAGMLGIFAAAMCRMADAKQVVAVDVNAERIETILRFGADKGCILPSDDADFRDGLRDILRNSPPDVALDFSGSPSAMETSLLGLGIGGVAVWVGATFPQRDLHVNAEVVIRNLYTIRGLHNYNAGDLVRAVEFLENHHDAFPFPDLIRDGFNLDSVNEAFACGVRDNPHRVGLRIDPSAK